MLNRKYFPFERNSYYFGKLLTAKDFEAEQRYLNDKRRFINRVLGENGIVAGLGVVMADDTSVIVQAGCAFDASGREIIVPETKVVKLSTIEGYAELATNYAYVGIEYEEQPADEVYGAMNEKSDACYNKVKESYKLTLLDENLVPKIKAGLSEFVNTMIIYSDNDITVTQHTPRFVTNGSEIVITSEIKKTSTGAGEYCFSYTLDVKGFTSDDGQDKLNIATSGIKLSAEQSEVFCYKIHPKSHIWGGGDIPLTASGFTVQKSDESFALNEQIVSMITPVQKDISELYLSNYYQKSMDKTLMDNYDQKLWIAKISLFRQKSSVLIDKVYPPPFGQYTYNSKQLMQLRQLEQYYPGAGKTVTQGTVHGLSDVTSQLSGKSVGDFAKQTACGVFDLGLGLGYSTREAIFSEEIMHGLGKGPVYVEVGIEYILADKQRGLDSSEILLGDINLFAKDGSRFDDERIYNISKAVKILPERGTFVVGVLPKESTGLISLRIRWYAMRLTEINKQLRSVNDGERYILLNPDTIVVPPKGTAHITPVFINMPTEACSYRLMDAEGGTIDNNGIYTAPAKEGVYEIRIEALSDSSVYTHAFAIVTQKKKEA